MQASIERGEVPAWWAAKLPDEIQQAVISKGKRLSAWLALDDPAKTERVSALIATHFGRVWAWHQQVDARLDEAWAAWDKARDNSNGQQKDELKALLVWTEQLAPIYAEFTPRSMLC